MNLTDPLAQLGNALEQATRCDLAVTTARRRRRDRFAVAAVALAVLVPGAAVAASSLFVGKSVAASMPAGTLALAGTNPTCTIVTKDVEFHCTLENAPAPEVSDWMGTVEPTVDASKHINGGCRSLASDGREWECYLGDEAVSQKIIGAGLLGEASSGPGVG